MTKKNSLTIISALEVYQQIGMQLSETGSEEVMNTTNEMQRHRLLMLQQVPIQFQKDGIEYLVLRRKEIQTLMGKSNDFQLENSADGIAPDLLQQCVVDMELCTNEDVAVCLERIASTFQVKVPDEIGLQEYFNILSNYPNFILVYATNNILAEYPYPRLPVPKDFVDRCEPMYKEHKDWLVSTARAFADLEIWRKKGGKVINKYIDNPTK